MIGLLSQAVSSLQGSSSVRVLSQKGVAGAAYAIVDETHGKACAVGRKQHIVILQTFGRTVRLSMVELYILSHYLTSVFLLRFAGILTRSSPNRQGFRTLLSCFAVV